jgi:hypothetical protein
MFLVKSLVHCVADILEDRIEISIDVDTDDLALYHAERIDIYYLFTNKL